MGGLKRSGGNSRGSGGDEEQPPTSDVALAELERLAREFRTQKIVFEAARDVYDQMQSEWQGTRCPRCGSTRLSKKLSVFASSGGGSDDAPSCTGKPSSCGMCGTGRAHSH